MIIKYQPKSEKDTTPIPGIEVAHFVLLPDDYGPDKRYGWAMFAHGKGELSGGTLENLENLALGQKQTDGTRKYPFVKDYHKEAVDKYKIILVIPTYDVYFTADKINWLHDYILKNYSVVYKMMGGGFSLGGGAFVDYAANVENAKKMAVCIPCAPVNNLGSSVLFPGTLPMHIFCATNDTNGATSISVTKNIVTKLNASNTGIKVRYTAFPIHDHIGFDQATTIAPPAAPAGQGVTDLNENVYEWYYDVLANGPRQMKSGATTGPVITEPSVPPVTVVQAILEHRVAGNTVYLDGSKSIGMKSAKLAAVAVPNGVNIYTTSIEGGGSAVGKITLTTPGIYKFRLTIYPETSYKGAPAEKEVEVNFGSVQPEPFKPTHTMITEDGTKKQIRLEAL